MLQSNFFISHNKLFLTSDKRSHFASTKMAATNETVVEHTRMQSHQDYIDYLKSIILKFTEERDLEKDYAKKVVKIDPFMILPTEIVFRILRFLLLNEICVSRRVSKPWKRTIENYFQHIRFLDFVPFESVLTAEGLKGILACVKNLRELQADTCWFSFTEESLSLLKNCPRLRSLSTSKCKGFTDEILQLLAVHCKELEELDLSSCFQISDEGLVPLAENCPKLKEVCVSSCYGITDTSVEALVVNCPFLQDLDISWCYKVTDQSLGLFLNPAKKIKSLRIKDCNRVTEEMITNLVDKGISVNCFF